MALFFMDYDAHRSGGKAAFANLFDFHADWQIQGSERLLNHAGVDAGIDQSAQRHVAADAAEAVKMSHFHGVSLLLVLLIVPQPSARKKEGFHIIAIEPSDLFSPAVLFQRRSSWLLLHLLLMLKPRKPPRACSKPCKPSWAKCSISFARWAMPLRSCKRLFPSTRRFKRSSIPSFASWPT